MKKVSVIVPVHNVELYLDKCIQSIINQTYKNLEIILVNDASIDNSLLICQKYAKQDNRIIVVNNNSCKGVSATKNCGLNIASGDYACFFDSDDYVELDFIEKLYHNIGNNDICIAGYITDEYNYKNELISSKTITLNIDKIDNSFPLNNYGKLFALCMSLCNKMYNLNLINKYNLRFNERVSFGEDGLFNADFFFLTNNLSFLNYAGYHYARRNNHSLSTKFYDDYLILKTNALKRRYELLLYWGLDKVKCDEFKYNSYFNIVWSELSNIKKRKYSTKDRNNKIYQIISNQEIIDNVKKYKPNNLKEKIKRRIFLLKNITLIYMVVGC